MRLIPGSLFASGAMSLFIVVFFFCKNLPTTPVPVSTVVIPDTFNSLETKDTLSYVMGKFDPATHEMFQLVEAKYANRTGMYLRKETYEAFLRMHAAALKEDVQLQIISATRNFNSQKTIWEDKWTGKRLVEDGQNLAHTTPDPVKRALKILEYSSMPGSSRHHWGTDMDLNALDNDYFKQGEGKKIYDWLTTHGAEYGFCQPYTSGRPHGYKEERWHWSYLPIALPLTGYCSKKIKNSMISGFMGSETANNIDIVNHYMLGINIECK